MKALLYLCMALWACTAVAQKHNHVWTCDDSLTINFTSGSPVFQKNSNSARRGNASYSDAAGRLLFYTNGWNAWDRTHAQMPSSTNLGYTGFDLFPHSTFILPFPDNPNKFYVFAAVDTGSPFGPSETPFGSYGAGMIYYYIVDLSLRSGLGDISKPAALLDTKMGFSICPASGVNCAVWLIAYHNDRSEFHSFKIDAAGISGPVVSVVPTDTAIKYYGRFELKMSPDGKMLAMCAMRSSGNVIKLCDFDPASGKLSNAQIIKVPILGTAPVGAEGLLSFSPKGSKLYCEMGHLLQFDLSLMPSVAAVEASAYILDSNYHISPAYPVSYVYVSSRIGPDDKVYISSDSTYDSRNPPRRGLSVVENPEAYGPACNFVRQKYSLKRNGTFGGYGLGVPVVSPKLVVTPSVIKDTAVCFDQPFAVSARPGYTSYTWSDGSAREGNVFTEPGMKWVYQYRDCGIAIDTFIVRAKALDTTFRSSDTLLCFAEKALLKAPAGYNRYLWHTGDTGSVLEVSGNGRYIACCYKGCGVTIDTITATFINYTVNLGPDDALCPGQEKILLAEKPVAPFEWQDGSSRDTFIATRPGLYWIRVHLDGCTGADSVYIRERQFSVKLGPDQELCQGKSLVLTSGVRQAEYLWQDGSRNEQLITDKEGVFWVQVHKEGCTASDTVEVRGIRCDDCVHIPNAFTPDNDGINDYFKIINECPVRSFRLTVYNRWGQLVYSNSNNAMNWDGTSGGKPLGIGTYYYLYEVLYDIPGYQTQRYKGDISILR